MDRLSHSLQLPFDGTTNPGGTQKPDIPLKGIRITIPCIVPGSRWNLIPTGTGTYCKVKTETYPIIASGHQHSSHKITT